MAVLTEEQRDLAISRILVEKEEAVDMDDLVDEYVGNLQAELQDLDNESLVDEYENYVGSIRELLEER